MERLELKKINGKPYYYYSRWAWVDGKCRRVWQKYLGKLEDIAKAVEGSGPAPMYAEVFQWGLTTALWNECRAAEVVEKIDDLCPKRNQGMTPGEYLAVAAVNRAVCPKSKRSMWEWFSQTTLLRVLPHASKAALTSQRFWDHMDRIDGNKSISIWKSILTGVVKRENIDVSSISYDGTNFYTFIDTFNIRCNTAKRGKNKQGRSNLRQISYALFCSADGHMPLYYDVYEGNRNDAKQFPLMLQKFHCFFKEFCKEKSVVPQTTLIFDKGNNSFNNFVLLDSLGVDFVGSVKLDEHKEIALISNNDPEFKPCADPELEGTKSFRLKKKVYGKERVLVASYNQNLYNAQWLTVQNDIGKAMEKLSGIQQNLLDRAEGLIKGGKKPTPESVRKKCDAVLKRPYMKSVIKVSVGKGKDDAPRLEYAADAEALHRVSDTYLGKSIIVASREQWDDEQIIKAYRSQYIIEDVFKEMKDRITGSWWPVNHWTDSKIRVHGLYCTIALLLRAVMLRRVKHSGLNLSMKRLLAELDAVREVVNVYPRRRKQKKERRQTVLSRTSDAQKKIMTVLGLEMK